MELIKIAEQERAEAIAEAASLRAALQARAKAVEPVNAPITFPTSLAELEPWAARHLVGRVYLLPRAYRAMRKSIYTDTERACRALLLLAGPYPDARQCIPEKLENR